MDRVDKQQASRILAWLDHASQHGARIKDPEEQLEIFQRLASLYAHRGQITSFQKSATMVSRIVKSSDDPELRTEAYAELAQACVRLGDRGRAQKLLMQAESALADLPDGFEKEMASRSISRVAGEAGNYALAERLSSRRGETDDVQLLLQRCQWYLKNAEATMAKNAIAEAAAAVKRFGTGSARDRSEKQDLLEGLLEVLLLADKIDAAEAIARQIDDSLQARYLAERQWALGRKARYQTTISRLRSLALRDGDRGANYHHPMHALEEIANLQHRIGDRAGYALTLQAARRLATKANHASSWVKTAVYGTLAGIQHRGGDTDASEQSLSIARSAAEDQTNDPTSDNSICCTVWLSVSDAEIKLDRFDAAVQSAKQIPKRDSRINQTAKAFARANRDPDAAELVKAAKSPEKAAELCLWIATHIALED